MYFVIINNHIHRDISDYLFFLSNRLQFWDPDCGWIKPRIMSNCLNHKNIRLLPDNCRYTSETQNSGLRRITTYLYIPCLFSCLYDQIHHIHFVVIPWVSPVFVDDPKCCGGIENYIPIIQNWHPPSSLPGCCWQEWDWSHKWTRISSQFIQILQVLCFLSLS